MASLLMLGVLSGSAAGSGQGSQAGGNAPATPDPSSFTTYAGRSLEQALLLLEQRGLRLVFSDRLVGPDLEVDREPTGKTARAVLDDLLRSHGLEAREGPGGVLVIVAAPSSGPVEESSESVGVPAGTRPGDLPITSEEIEVRSEPPGILGEEISSLTLDPLVLRSLPAVAEDPVRSASRLPGATASDVSAEIQVRGSHTDEVMIRLDGLELPEPYHLRDFNNALSIVAPVAVGGAELFTGGFPVEYGDRSGGVLNLSTREPQEGSRWQLGLSAYHLEAAGAGRWTAESGDNRGSWLATARAGSLKLAARVANLDKEPEFADLFGKVTLDLAPGQFLLGHLLLSRDELKSLELDVIDEAGGGTGSAGGSERFDTRYGNRYGWLTHGALVGSSLYLESRGSITRIRRDRNGLERSAADGHFDLLDDRLYFVVAVAQDGEARLFRRHELKWGFDTRWLEVDYDYAVDFELTDPLAALRHRPAAGSLRFERRLDGRQYGVYLADQWTPSPSLSLEVGLRFDENTLLDDESVSPRFSLHYRLGSASTLRLAWGLFHQTQRVYELQVEDGETAFSPGEKAEHRILGFEHSFGRRALGGGHGRPLTLRAELYERRIRDPRARWENLFDPVSLTPELEADRARIAPEAGRARGVELLLSGGLGRRLDGYLSYAWSEAEDRIDGREVPRGVDQPHTVELQLSWRTPWRWDLDLAWTWRTGWPTTAVTARRGDDGSIEPVLGPLRGERLPDYHRLDLGARRAFVLPRGELEVYVDVQNLTGAKNLRGFEVALEQLPDGTPTAVRRPKDWGPPIPTFGVRWRF